jgi:cell division protease FtsH
MKKSILRNARLWIIILLGLALWFAVSSFKDNSNNISYTDLVTSIQNNQVESITVDSETSDAKVQFKKEFMAGKAYVINVGSIQQFQNFISEYNNKPENAAKKVAVRFTAPARFPIWVSAIPNILMLIMLGVVWFVFMQQSQGGAGGKGVMNFGKSRARLASGDRKKVTFSDVAGADEEKEELREVVDFLTQPRKYIELGARIPKGILLVGPPGTGKTLLAKAVAGEAGVPFFQHKRFRLC